MPSCFVSNPSGASCDEGYVIGSFVGVGAGAVGVAEALGIGDADCVAARNICLCHDIILLRSCYGYFYFADFFGGFLNLFLHGMVAFPCFLAVTVPFLLTEAVFLLEDLKR